MARHYGLKRTGAVAPGYTADLVILSDAQTCAISNVLKKGIPVSELEFERARASSAQNTVKASAPEAHLLKGPEGRVHVIGVRHGRILTDRHVMNHNDEGVAHLTVLERHGKNLKPSNGYVTGFGNNFRGAIASSVGHDSHNLIVAGKNPEDMRIALNNLIQSGGGFCVVENGEVSAALPLPFGGLMSTKPHGEIASILTTLKDASSAAGCELPEPFLQLAFLSLPVIPSLKLTDKGLVDVDQFKIIDVRA